MTIFTWLLVGHLIGDWLLQNDWMAKGKKRGFFSLAGFSHFIIYTAAIVLMLSLSQSEEWTLNYYFALGLLVFVSHWLIDATTIVERWIRFYGQTDSIMMRVMVDQTLHIIVLAMITLLIF